MTGVSPVIPGRWSMTAEEAQNILCHPHVALIPGYIVAEARKVAESGAYWVWPEGYLREVA